MSRPVNATAYEPIDLKLGIKSSLPRVKSTLALLILMWESQGEPAELVYADEDGNALKLKAEIQQRLIDMASGLGVTIGDQQFQNIVANNCLLASQLEALIVAFELVWKLGRIRFLGNMANSAERTGQKRYVKKIAFSSNMDILGAMISNNDAYKKTLFAWLGAPVAKDQDAESRLIRVFTAFSEEAVFKLVDGANDVIFNLESVYSTMITTGQAVDISGDAEAKGPLRILKSAASENMIYNVQANGGLLSTADPDFLTQYHQRVVTRHQLISRVPGIEVNVEENTAQPEATHDLGAYNVLLYGVPGSGKSHEIKTNYCDDETRMERVVFHPDYTYSDFVGQIMPSSIDGHISYPFIPGPFTRILKKAVANPDQNYYLIVEEINRGNAPAIFGEIFQLLDRENGESEYGISNADIALSVYGDAAHMVKIPANLYILATMNTADQNVFTLDTAFKRRWTMRSIENDFSQCTLRDISICGTNISWRGFAETINNLIIELGEGNIGSEDKRLGAYFVKESELRDSRAFSEKVLMYLWNDAFKYDHDKVFRSEYKTLEQLLKAFETSLFSVFVDTIVFPTVVPAAVAANDGQGDAPAETTIAGDREDDGEN